MGGDFIHEEAARGFERGAEDYERGRPGYPAAAIELLAAELGLGPGRTVVDLAAGTGKLTRELVGTGAWVIAVEPVAAMRGQLARAVPTAEVLDGRAEAIALKDASVEAVVVAQAFHWFDTPAAAREIHRVLVPGGGLGIIYNVWDERVDWVARLERLLDAYRGDTPQRRTSAWREQLDATELFTTLQDQSVTNVVHGTLDQLEARVASISYIAVLDDAERSRLLAEVRALVAEHSEAWHGDQLTMPYVTHVSWCQARLAG